MNENGLKKSHLAIFQFYGVINFRKISSLKFAKLEFIKFLSKRLIDGMEPFYRGEGLGEMRAGKLDKNGMLKGSEQTTTFGD